MPWLKRLDARAKQWHWITRAPYLALKWYLILLGGFLVIRLMLDRMHIWPIY